jgi:hypothetical protein
MRPNLNLVPGFPNCKIKRVNPAFRSVSTPRCTKDLPVVDAVNPTSTLGWPNEPPLGSEWRPERLGKELRNACSRGALERLIRAAWCAGWTVEPRLRARLLEVV